MSIESIQCVTWVFRVILQAFFFHYSLRSFYHLSIHFACLLLTSPFSFVSEIIDRKHLDSCWVKLLSLFVRYQIGSKNSNARPQRWLARWALGQREIQYKLACRWRGISIRWMRVDVGEMKLLQVFALLDSLLKIAVAITAKTRRAYNISTWILASQSSTAPGCQLTPMVFFCYNCVIIFIMQCVILPESENPPGKNIAKRLLTCADINIKEFVRTAEQGNNTAMAKTLSSLILLCFVLRLLFSWPWIKRVSWLRLYKLWLAISYIIFIVRYAFTTFGSRSMACLAFVAMPFNNVELHNGKNGYDELSCSCVFFLFMLFAFAEFRIEWDNRKLPLR